MYENIWVILGLIWLAIGICYLVVGQIAASKQNTQLMNHLIKQKKDEEKLAFLARAKKSSLMLGVVLAAAGVLFIFVL